ncbi:MAG: hypothetical protein Q8R36_05495 [bacterium]|nr:hypothetical protein [bacterium]
MKGNRGLRKRLEKIISSNGKKNWWIPELFEKNTRKILPKELEILAAPPKEDFNYNCYVYVLGLQKNPDFLGRKGWSFMRELGGAFDEMIKKEILKHALTPQKGRLVVYRADDGGISHVGLLESKEIVVSKWSWGSFIRHRIWDVPEGYGDIAEFYKITNTARNYVLKLRQNKKTAATYFAAAS